MKSCHFCDLVFLIVFAIVVKCAARSTGDVQFSITKINRCIVLNETNFLTSVIKISAKECGEECGKRPDCRAVNYRRRTKICELLSTETGTLLTNSVQTGPCALMLMSDIKGLQSCDCTSGDVCDGPTCERKECQVRAPKNSQIIGNLNNVESRIFYNCSSGYTNTGDEYATCLTVGTWSHQPQCVLDCGLPANVKNALVNFYSTIENSTAIYACESTFVHVSGDLLHACESDGNWHGVLPTCIIDCGSPADAKNALISFSTTTENSKAIYACESSFVHVSGDLTHTCGSDGNWNGILPTCTISCGLPESVTSATKVFTSTLETSTVEYTCISTFVQVSGNLVLTCGSDGNWNGILPTCKKDCGTPVSVLSATRTFTATAEDSEVKYSCLNGYVHTSGDLTHVCTSYGNWAGTLPTCAIDCGTPVSVLSATSTFTATVEDSEVKYSCLNGYVHTYGDLTHVCTSYGNWAGTLPTCAIDCGTPVSVLSATRTFTATVEDSEVKYSCLNGYVHTYGDLTHVCTSYGNWAGTLPTCAIDCGTPVSVRSATRTFTATVEDSEVKYSCLNGYVHTNGDLTHVCTSYGNWAGTLPTCTIDCLEPPYVPNSLVSSGNTYKGHQRTYTCNSGKYFYTGVDSLTTLCQSTGQWSNMNEICPTSGSNSACLGCGVMEDCDDAQSLGATQSGTYLIHATGNGVSVYCDMATSSGGWTVIQRRTSNTDFYKTWEEYKNGFGSVPENYWLGNNIVATLTGLASYKIRFDLFDQNDYSYAEYKTFTLSGESEGYKLTLGRYSGTAGDSLIVHNGQRFSTKDRDNDPSSDTHCAQYYSGAWWYAGCHNSNLNGLYGSSVLGHGINWNTFRGIEHSLSKTEIKIKRI